MRSDLLIELRNQASDCDKLVETFVPSAGFHTEALNSRTQTTLLLSRCYDNQAYED